jgi:hypothetical protein
VQEIRKQEMEDYMDSADWKFASATRNRTSGRPLTAEGHTAREAILAGATNKEAVALVREHHPTARMSARSVANIRWALKKLHPELPSSYYDQAAPLRDAVRPAEDAKVGRAADARTARVAGAGFLVPSIANATVSSYVWAEGAAALLALTERGAGDGPARDSSLTTCRCGRRARTSRTVVSVVEEAIRAGATDSEALGAVLATIPYARTNLRSVAIYRSNLRTEGEALLTSSQVKRAKAKVALEPTR